MTGWLWPARHPLSAKHMTVAIVCAFYYCYDDERADITRRLFKHLSTVPDSVFIGVGSEGDVSRDLFAEHHPVDRYVEFHQDWDTIGASGHAGLRRKYNTAVRAARDYEPEFVFCLGSDDFDPVEFYAPSDADLVGHAQGPRGGAYFWQYEWPTAYWWDGKSPFSDRGTFAGGTLGFSTRYLDGYDWEPWRFPGDEIGIERQARLNGATLEAREGLQAWHPKSDVVLNSMRNIRRHLTLLDADPDVVQEWLDYWDSLGES